jgi:large subunit ribosomal protein L25
MQAILKAYPRQATGKGTARKLRREEKIPAIFYGPGSDSVMLTVNTPELETIIKGTAGENVILDLQMEMEGGTTSKKAILKDLQIDPVKDVYLHADFYEISMDKEITVDIPIQLINTPVGVSMGGGILQHIRRELTISCLPGDIIDALELDVSHLEIGDALHISDITMPAGIVPLEEAHLTVAVVAAPTVVEEAVEEEVSEEEAAEETEEAAGEKETEED